MNRIDLCMRTLSRQTNGFNAVHLSISKYFIGSITLNGKSEKLLRGFWKSHGNQFKLVVSVCAHAHPQTMAAWVVDFLVWAKSIILCQRAIFKRVFMLSFCQLRVSKYATNPVNCICFHSNAVFYGLPAAFVQCRTFVANLPINHSAPKLERNV